MSAPGDSLVVSVNDMITSWTVEIDLDNGTATCRKQGDPPRGTSSIDAETLAALRGHAARAFEGGDLQYSEQFADGSTDIVITLGGHAVTLRYVTAGAGRLSRGEELFQFACTCVRPSSS